MLYPGMALCTLQREGPPGRLYLEEDQLSPLWLNLALILGVDMYRAGQSISLPSQLS